jgi:transposase
MVAAQIQYVVGIDVAKQAHVVCALNARTGAVQQRPLTIAATAEGYAQLCALLQAWAEPAAILVGVEATGCLWEPLYDALTAAGHAVLVLNPRQTANWAASFGLRAKTDGIDAHTLARGLLAGYAQGSTVPSEAVQELRALTRARWDLVQGQSAAKQRLRDELVVLFPELPGHTPERCALMAPSLLRVLSVYGSAQAMAQAPLADLTALLEAVSEGRWTTVHAAALQHLAQRSAAGTRAVGARGLVVQTLARHLLDLQQRIAELTTAIADVLARDEEGQRLCRLSGIGPIIAATIRAEVGDVQRFGSVDQVIAYAGLDPRVRKSGAFVGQAHLSKRGPGALRHALYLAALGAVRSRPEWRERYERLLQRGRARKEALTILSRKLLKVIYYLLRTGTTYDATPLKPCPAPGRA